MDETCFGELRERNHDWKINPGVRESWHAKGIQRLLASMWEYPDVTDAEVEEAEESVEARFMRLAGEWSGDTVHVSSVTDLINHPSYQQIINLGWRVVPYLLTDLQANKRFWFPALAAITGIRPFDPSDAGNGRRMMEAWTTWGKRKGLI